MSMLETEGLTKRYPAFTLDRVSFSLREGAITGFIGRNGAGKTTTLKCLLGLVCPDGGEVRFFGLPFAGHEGEIKGRLGWVPAPPSTPCSPSCPTIAPSAASRGRTYKTSSPWLGHNSAPEMPPGRCHVTYSCAPSGLRRI